MLSLAPGRRVGDPPDTRFCGFGFGGFRADRGVPSARLTIQRFLGSLRFPTSFNLEASSLDRFADTRHQSDIISSCALLPRVRFRDARSDRLGPVSAFEASMAGMDRKHSSAFSRHALAAPKARLALPWTARWCGHGRSYFRRFGGSRSRGRGRVSSNRMSMRRAGAVAEPHARR
jgi:hypothetical protein